MCVEESTTEERIFGEQCFMSGILPRFPRPLPLPEEGHPVRQWLPAALLPSHPQVLEAKGTLCGAAEGSCKRSHLAAGSSRRGGSGRAGGGRGWEVSVWCGERLVRCLRGEEKGTGLLGGTEKVSSPFPGMEGGDQTGTMWRPKLSPCSFMWFPW